MLIAPGDLDDPRILALLGVHLKQARAATAEGSAHALDVSGLKGPDIEFYAMWEAEELVAVGALRETVGRGEVKSMHTAEARRRSGAAAEMLAHLVRRARARGLKRISLETGSWDFFRPARRLYRRFGFCDCPPFAPYKADPNSVFLTLDLGDEDQVVETRAAEEADLPAILSIYNQIIKTSTAVYRDEPTTLEERTAWYRARKAAGFPVLVAERGEEVLGFASYGDWRGTFPGYRRTVEHTVHIGDGARGLGVGAALMGHLTDIAHDAGMHVMLGAVDADNEGSLRFHERLGFQRVSHFREVGRKFERWLDLVFVQKTLG